MYNKTITQLRIGKFLLIPVIYIQLSNSIYGQDIKKFEYQIGAGGTLTIPYKKTISAYDIV
ncbi:MAG: hypothetical protein CMO01_05155 [Thalassobius sp.]|nr:hypothetical protein [Thalassovita sp.]|tara:strand:+ start:391 stop:573 length:183 start_codon:yes stop_codon:yes gene_type:complete